MLRVGPLLALVAGVLLVGAGLLTAIPSRTASLGWTAYSPLSGQAYPVLVGSPWWALALLGVGAATVGAAATLLVMRRFR